MKEFLVLFWTNKDMAARTLKGVVFFLATAASAGLFGPLPEGWSGQMLPAILQALSIMWPAGTANVAAKS